MKMLARIVAVTLAMGAGSAAHAMQDSATPAAAAAPAAIKAGALLVTADGARLGRIERVSAAADGSPERVSVIYNSRFVQIPASTLTASGRGFVTSLTKAEVRKLK